MSKFTVHKGQHYRAVISLRWWEQAFATNEKIAEMLRDVGFTEVSVTGGGEMREAKGLWPLQDTTAEIPAQVISVHELQSKPIPT